MYISKCGGGFPLRSLLCIGGMFMLMVLILLSLVGPQPIRDLEPPHLVPTSMLGLKPEHHGELNKLNVPSSRFDTLRGEYANDPKAQQQIDVYDPSTMYHEKLKEYVQAIKENDKERMVELEDWFDEHYPDI